jgi:hypothetical protein
MLPNPCDCSDVSIQPIPSCEASPTWSILSFHSAQSLKETMLEGVDQPFDFIDNQHGPQSAAMIRLRPLAQLPAAAVRRRSGLNDPRETTSTKSSHRRQR